jgi:pimeloyl-ACP methyl ester carboxylesterase
VSISGGTLYVKSWTPVSVRREEPVLLLHDSIGCVGLWRDFPALLADRTGRKVVAYDRLGFGKSTPRTDAPSPNFIAEEAHVLRALMAQLEIPSAALFGYSVGGSMALCAAASDPEAYVAVISESAQAFVEDQTLRGIEAARERFADPEQRAKLVRWHGERTDWILKSWMDVWSDPNYAGWSLREVLPQVKCPVLAIHGDRDEFGTFAFPRMIAGLASGESEMLLLKGCGHIPHREKAVEVLAAVERLLR